MNEQTRICKEMHYYIFHSSFHLASCKKQSLPVEEVGKRKEEDI